MTLLWQAAHSAPSTTGATMPLQLFSKLSKCCPKTQRLSFHTLSLYHSSNCHERARHSKPRSLGSYHNHIVCQHQSGWLPGEAYDFDMRLYANFCQNVFFFFFSFLFCLPFSSRQICWETIFQWKSLAWNWFMLLKLWAHTQPHSHTHTYLLHSISIFESKFRILFWKTNNSKCNWVKCIINWRMGVGNIYIL